MVFVHCYLLEGVVLENLLRSLRVITTLRALAAANLYLLRRGLCFLFFFFFCFVLAVCILDV
jgi:hypothetical protein